MNGWIRNVKICNLPSKGYEDRHVILSTEGGTAEMNSADENRAGNTADNVGARNEKTDWNK